MSKKRLSHRASKRHGMMLFRDDDPNDPEFEGAPINGEFDIVEEHVVDIKLLSRSGGNSIVQSGFDLGLERRVVLKVMEKYNHERLTRGVLKRDILRELGLLERIPQHENICQFYYALETPAAVVAVLEDCGRDNLEELTRLKLRAPLDEQTAARYMRDVLAALSALHRASIYHRDVKLPNMVLSYAGRVKLVDFGSAVRSNALSSQSLSSPGYASPEMAARKGYRPELLDSWGVGVSTFRLVFFDYPFGMHLVSPPEERRRLLDCSYELPARFRPSAELSDFFSKIFVPESHRWTASQLLEHPWITKYQ